MRKKYFSMFLGVLLLAMMFSAGCAVSKRTAGWEREQRVATGDTSHLLKRADELWVERDDQKKLEEAIDLYEEAAKRDPGNLELLTKLSRANYLLADAYLEDNIDKQLEVYDKGTAWGEKAMATNPKFKEQVDQGAKVEDAVKELDHQYVGAIYWTAVNLGKWAKKKGFVTLLANKDKARKMIARVLELDETFYYGAAHRYFGTYYAVAPSFAGGDLNKSKEHFEKSLDIAPNYFATRVLRAENYSVKQQNAEGKELYRSDLEFVLNTDPNILPDVAPEQKSEQRKAKKLLEEIDQKFIQ